MVKLYEYEIVTIYICPDIRIGLLKGGAVAPKGATHVSTLRRRTTQTWISVPLSTSTFRLLDRMAVQVSTQTVNEDHQSVD